jgi:hypothetical protein
LGKGAKEQKGPDQNQHLRQHGGWLVVVTVFQMVALGQFIEGLVFDPPAAVAGLINLNSAFEI